MKIYDITRELLSADVYEGDTSPKLKPAAKEEEGGFNTSDIEMSLHNGTHIDAPRHVLSEGDDVASLPLEKCFGRCTVLTLGGKVTLRALWDLKKRGVKKVLLRGGVITPTAAVWLSLLKFELIGVEDKSVGNRAVHKSLLRAGTVILEGVDLGGVPDGSFLLLALPLKIAGADGSPVRAVLINTGESADKNS